MSILGIFLSIIAIYLVYIFYCVSRISKDDYNIFKSHRLHNKCLLFSRDSKTSKLKTKVRYKILDTKSLFK